MEAIDGVDVVLVNGKLLKIFKSPYLPNLLQLIIIDIQLLQTFKISKILTNRAKLSQMITLNVQKPQKWKILLAKTNIIKIITFIFLQNQLLEHWESRDNI